MNDEGINGFLGKAMCNGEENCCTGDDDCKTHGITQPDQVHWCGDNENEVDKLLTCGGKNRNTKGPPAADVTTGTCAVSAVGRAKCTALQATACAADDTCSYDSQTLSCGPSASLESTCSGAASSAEVCEGAGDCTYTSAVVISTGSTCKTKLQCVKIWLASRIRLFAAVMFAFLFLESYVHLESP